MSLVRSLRDNLKSLGKSNYSRKFYSFVFVNRIGFVEEIEMIETEDESKPKRPTTTTKKRTVDVLESTVRNNEENLLKNSFFCLFKDN